MTVDKIALVDADFLIQLSEAKHPYEEIKSVVINIITQMRLLLHMHPYVWKNEIINRSSTINRYREDSILSVPDLDDIFDKLGPGSKEYYAYLLPELYKKAFGECVDLTEDNVFTYWKRGASFGEVHSVCLCFVAGYGIFLSDDHGSRVLASIIREDYSKTINVYNRKEILQQIDSSAISHSTRRSFTHSL